MRTALNVGIVGIVMLLSTTSAFSSLICSHDTIQEANTIPANLNDEQTIEKTTSDICASPSINLDSNTTNSTIFSLASSCNTPPLISNESPGNDTSQVFLRNRTSIQISDKEGDKSLVCFWYSLSDSPYNWMMAQQNDSVIANTTVMDTNSTWITSYATEYWWVITADDGHNFVRSKIYHFWTIPFNVYNSKYYYVSDSNGSDYTGDGSWGNPFKTIRKATVTVSKWRSPGSGYSIFVRSGTYNGGQFNNIGELTEGTPQAWLTLSAMPDAKTHYENVRINRTFFDGYDSPPNNGYTGMFYFSDVVKKYIHIKGFEFYNGTLLDYDKTDTPDACAFGIKLSSVCHNFTIEDCYFENISDGAIILSGVKDVTIRNNSLYNICNCHGKYIAGQEGISVQSASQRIEIDNNTLSLIPKIMIDVKASSRNIQIHNNRLNTTQSTNPNGGGIICDAQTTFTNQVTINNNIIWGNHTGIVMSTERGGTVKNTTIFNNILNMSGDATAIYIYSLKKGIGSNLKDNITIEYNTLYGQHYLFWVNTWERELKNVIFANNILDNNQVSTGINYFNSSYQAIIVKSNLFNVSISDTWGIGSIMGSPLFIHPGNNFHLYPSSPAVDHASQDYIVPLDFDAVMRPQGFGYDIGAYEYTE